MPHITTVADALAALHDRSGYERGFISNPFAGDEAARLGLRRTQGVLDRLENPERDYRIVHIAGSKGKGSTAAFTSAILNAAGLVTGRYTSPHLHRWHERFVVNDREIRDTTLTTLTRDAVAAAEALEADQPELGTVTAFELTTAMALLHFSRTRCDVAVIEVGLGGTLDATNIVAPDVAVITTLDLEHTAILGETIEEIASNKAGVIKPGAPVVVARQLPAARDVIHAQAEACGSPFVQVGTDIHASGSPDAFTAAGPWGTFEDLHPSMPGTHQVHNALLAIAATWLLDAPIDAGAVRTGLDRAQLPGRFERARLSTNNQNVVLDGAHTPAAMAALAETLATMYPDRQIVAIIGMLQDKAPDRVLAPLVDSVSHWIATAPESPRAAPAEDIATTIRALGGSCTVACSPWDALNAARKSFPDAVIVITGSFTTVADARRVLDLV